MTYPLRLCLLLLSAGLIGIGCNKDETAIRTYSAPKDIPPPPQVASADQPPAAEAQTPDRPEQESAAASPITWIVPDGWKQAAGGNGMRFATIQVSADDPKAQLTVVPLPMEAAAVLPNVQRWAGQLKLPEVAEADVPKFTQQTQVSGEQATIVDMTGPAEPGTPPTRLLAAIVPHEGRAWFFTLKAPEPLAASQKAAFEKFIHSIQFPTGPAASNSPAEGPGPSDRDTDQSFKLVKWKTPDGWEEQPGSNSMRVTSFRVGNNDQHTEVIVSKIPIGGFGSIPDNLNRWRGQVGLEPVDRPEPDTKEPVTLGGHGALLLSFKGPASGATPARTALIAMDQEGHDLWFIKLLGPDSVVARQQDAFKQFLGSLQFEPETH